jgi:hypothetical protein
MPASIPSRHLHLTWSKQDGINLGGVVVLSMTQNRIDWTHDDVTTIVSKLRDLLLKVDCVQGMEELLTEHPMLPHILGPVVKHAHVQFPKYVHKLLLELTELEAGRIGRALSKSVFFRKTSDAAVAEWIGKYPGLAQFAEENIWFEPMMGVIAQHLVASSRRGAIFRLLVGVVISESDLVSDVNVIIVFLSTAGLANFGWALLGMLAANMMIGLLLAYIQNRKKSKWEAVKECLFVVLGLMPGVAAYRVAKMKKQRKDEAVDAKLVVAFTKGIEMFTEGSKLRVVACLVCGCLPRCSRARVSIHIYVNSLLTLVPTSVSHLSTWLHLADIRSNECHGGRRRDQFCRSRQHNDFRPLRGRKLGIGQLRLRRGPEEPIYGSKFLRLRPRFRARQDCDLCRHGAAEC